MSIRMEMELAIEPTESGNFRMRFISHSQASENSKLYIVIGKNTNIKKFLVNFKDKFGDLLTEEQCQQFMDKYSGSFDFNLIQ